MSLEEEKQIKFPDKHYVGFQKRDKEGISLGFMTPYGTDAQAKKRIATVDTWAGSGYGTYNSETRQYDKLDKIPPIIYDNKPMTGFKVSHTVNHSSSWNSCADKWRILDPRGFELEITSGNFERVLEFTDVLKGEIQGELIWARLKGNNVLVPVATDIYRNTMDNTTRDKSKVSLKELRPGYKATLKNGNVGTYMGLFHLVQNVSYSSDSAFNYMVTAKKRHVFMKEDKSGFFFYATPILSFIESGEEITNGVAVVNSLLSSDPKINITGTDSYVVGVCSRLDIKFELTELKNQTLETVKDSGHTCGYSPYEQGALTQFGIRYNYPGHRILANLVRDTDLTYMAKFKRDSRYHYGWNSSIPEYNSQLEIPTIPSKFSVYYGTFIDGVQRFKFPI